MKGLWKWIGKVLRIVLVLLRNSHLLDGYLNRAAISVEYTPERRLFWPSVHWCVVCADDFERSAATSGNSPLIYSETKPHFLRANVLHKFKFEEFGGKPRKVYHLKSVCSFDIALQNCYSCWWFPQCVVAMICNEDFFEKSFKNSR